MMCKNGVLFVNTLDNPLLWHKGLKSEKVPPVPSHFIYSLHDSPFEKKTKPIFSD